VYEVGDRVRREFYERIDLADLLGPATGTAAATTGAETGR